MPETNEDSFQPNGRYHASHNKVMIPARGHNVYTKTGKQQTYGGMVWTTKDITVDEIVYIDGISECRVINYATIDT
jgi:hypothetical protein